MNVEGLLIKINDRLDKQIGRLQELAKSFKEIDNYDEIARIKELESFRKYLITLTNKNRKESL